MWLRVNRGPIGFNRVGRSDCKNALASEWHPRARTQDCNSSAAMHWRPLESFKESNSSFHAVSQDSAYRPIGLLNSNLDNHCTINRKCNAEIDQTFC
jgi:hypothetical protein